LPTSQIAARASNLLFVAEPLDVDQVMFKRHVAQLYSGANRRLGAVVRAMSHDGAGFCECGEHA
jgi:hypothetical protein